MLSINTYIIYNSSNDQSVKNANHCLNSFAKFYSWSPKLFDGCTPYTLSDFDEKYKISNDRSARQPGHSHYESKKSCFYSHFSLWLKCIELNENIAIVEHDTYCIGDLPISFKFDGIVQFSAESILRIYNNRFIGFYDIYKKLPPGLHSVENFPPISFLGKHYGHCIASNTAYGITPHVAKILVDDCIKNGWMQNDLLMSTSLCKVEVMVPSFIAYDLTKEIKSSSMEWKQHE